MQRYLTKKNNKKMDYKFEQIDGTPSLLLPHLKEFLDNEIGDYPYFYEDLVIVHDDTIDNFEIFTVIFQNCKNVKIKINANIMFVELNEIWHETDEHSWQIKHFWMALLN